MKGRQIVIVRYEGMPAVSFLKFKIAEKFLDMMGDS